MTTTLRLATLFGVALSFTSLPTTSAFVRPTRTHAKALTSRHRQRACASASASFDVMIDLPGEGLSAQMKFPPVLDVPSEIIEVRYRLPFGLDVAPKDQMCKCTKDGEGGEKVGDVLRFCSQWTLGLPRGDGAVTTVASFGGAVSWQVSMFDVMRADSWNDVVAALTSNVPERTDEVVLLFERPLPGGPE